MFVLDSACSSTVCSQPRMDKYMSSLSEEERNRVVISQSKDWFKFGGGERLHSKGKYTVPAVLAGKQVQICTDVVDSHILLLLSLGAMKKAGIKLDTKKCLHPGFPVKL